MKSNILSWASGLTGLVAVILIITVRKNDYAAILTIFLMLAALILAAISVYYSFKKSN